MLRAASASANSSSSQNALTTSQGGLTGFVPMVVFSNTGTVTTSGTSPSTLIPSGIGVTAFPANYFVPGKAIRIKVGGVMTTAATPGTVTPILSLGANTIWNGAAETPTLSIICGFEMEVVITCLTTGAGGTCSIIAHFYYVNGLNAAPSYLGQYAVASVAFDTTSSKALTFTLTNSVSGGAVFAVNTFLMEVLA